MLAIAGAASLWGATTAMAAADAHASDPVTQTDTGEIVRRDASSVVIRTSRETLSFDDADSVARIPKNARVGDELTVRYAHEDGKLKLQSAALGKGGANAGKRKPQAGKKGKEVIDDRAFYSAQSEQGEKARQD